MHSRIIDAVSKYLNSRGTNLQRRKSCKHIRSPRFYPYEDEDKPNKLSQGLLLNGTTFQDCHKLPRHLVGTGTLSLPSSIMGFELLHYAGQSRLQLPSSRPPCKPFNYTYSSPFDAAYILATHD